MRERPPVGTIVSVLTDTGLESRGTGIVVRHVGQETVEVQLENGELHLYHYQGLTEIEK